MVRDKGENTQSKWLTEVFNLENRTESKATANNMVKIQINPFKLLSHFMRKISADRFSPKFHKLNNPSVSSQRGDYCYYPLCNSLPCLRGSFMKSVSTHCLYRDEAKLMVSSMSTPCRIHHVRAVCWFKGCCRTCYRLVLLNTCTLELPRSF